MRKKCSNRIIVQTIILFTLSYTSSYCQLIDSSQVELRAKLSLVRYLHFTTNKMGVNNFLDWKMPLIYFKSDDFKDVVFFKVDTTQSKNTMMFLATNFPFLFGYNYRNENMYLLCGFRGDGFVKLIFDIQLIDNLSEKELSRLRIMNGSEILNPYKIQRKVIKSWKHMSNIDEKCIKQPVPILFPILPN